MIVSQVAISASLSGNHHNSDQGVQKTKENQGKSQYKQQKALVNAGQPAARRQEGWATAAEGLIVPPGAKWVPGEAPAGEMRQVPQDVTQAESRKSERSTVVPNLHGASGKQGVLPEDQGRLQGMQRAEVQDGPPHLAELGSDCGTVPDSCGKNL